MTCCKVSRRHCGRRSADFSLREGRVCRGRLVGEYRFGLEAGGQVRVVPSGQACSSGQSRASPRGDLWLSERKGRMKDHQSSGSSNTPRTIARSRSETPRNAISRRKEGPKEGLEVCSRTSRAYSNHIHRGPVSALGGVSSDLSFHLIVKGCA